MPLSHITVLIRSIFPSPFPIQISSLDILSCEMNSSLYMYASHPSIHPYAFSSASSFRCPKSDTPFKTSPYPVIPLLFSWLDRFILAQVSSHQATLLSGWKPYSSSQRMAEDDGEKKGELQP